ncbi:NAD(P)H-binding protein [Arthrobacter sp. ISL-72]|uniref:NAD(P)H-binding protein n=1 Tax=Arthrobacter sp. ISL-72 TaxID=2819114 RepID=UPI001BE697CF|nr:NAD(P)H-binding protein [Arthrobacter sp. ISL-72]MBT2598135.1 NmrA family NAD(P)-binding protein [Arthrobacter sp. ISL-72]
MILVTGSTGALGSAILTALTTQGVKAEGSSRSLQAGMRVIDFDRPSTVDFTGVETLVLVSAGEAEDDVVIARHQAAITAAQRDGVTHIVYTSLTSSGDHLAFALAHRWTENHLQESGISWTILRNGLYAELFGSMLTWSDGRLHSAFGNGALAAVAREDLAAVAAIVSTTPENHAGQTYDLVGSPITAAEVAAALNTNLNDTPLDKRRDELLVAELKPFQPAMLMSIYTSVRHGFLGNTSGDLESLLRRRPKDAITVAASATATSGPSAP